MVTEFTIVNWTGKAPAPAPKRKVAPAIPRPASVEIAHPGVEKDVTVLWCKSELERDEVVAAINSLMQRR